MKDHPAFMSIQICRMRLLDEPAVAASDTGRAMATEAIRLAALRRSFPATQSYP